MKSVDFFNYKLINLNIESLNNKINQEIYKGPKIINCMNPHSFVISQKDKIFSNAISNAYLNLIDGVGISLYLTIKNLTKINRITGYDLFEKIISENKKIKIFFLGSTNKNLERINERILKENKNIFVEYHSPSFSKTFTDEENNNIIDKINSFNPDYLFIGMTAPKQEKWSYIHRDKIKAKFIINIGAVFDYYAGTFTRPFKLIRDLGLEWIFRLLQNPKLWRRTLISLPIFFYYIIKEIIYSRRNFSIKIVDEIDKLNQKINFDENYIFSAFNLAMTSNLLRKNIKFEQNLTFWSDGIFCKFFNRKIKKIAGNKFLENIKLGDNFKKIHVIGNLHELDRIYIEKKFFGLELIFTKLPFADSEDLIFHIPNIDKDSLLLLTIPTPKQEVVAQKIFEKNKFGKIICIGGGLSIASGYEKKCPNILEKIGLEFIWRLRNETKRRSLRLLRDITIILFSLITFRLHKFKVKQYDE